MLQCVFTSDFLRTAAPAHPVDTGCVVCVAVCVTLCVAVCVAACVAMCVALFVIVCVAVCVAVRGVNREVCAGDVV